MTTMNDENGVEGEQVRVAFVLDKTIQDDSLKVPTQPIAIPSHLKKKGLSAVINHLLDRKVEVGDQDDQDDDDDDDEKLPAVAFDFIINGKLLRTGVENAARRYGLSLEEAIPISYFPAQEAPEQSGESEPIPDWISSISILDSGKNIVTGGYDGCLRLHTVSNGKGNDNDKSTLETTCMATAHSSPIKCLATTSSSNSDASFIATASLDQTLKIHSQKDLVLQATCVDGHQNTVGSLAFSSTNKLVSGDWDGGLAVWDLENLEEDSNDRQTLKKLKGSNAQAQATATLLKPSVVFKAHGGNVSGVAWLPDGKHVVTSSWDHSIKVWDIDTQDCLLTLNGSKVISCMDLSPHSQVVATGHPDCTVRLWDIRTNDDATSSLVSDSTLKPSHKEFVSSVRWSPTNPYLLASAAYDGRVKVWDIRSTLPLHTVKTQDEKSFCLAFGDDTIYSGGTDGILKQYDFKQ